MEYRRLGNTDLQVSPLSFGTWGIGGSWGAAVAEKAALEGLAVAIDAGVNFFDTADVYGEGRAERFLAQATKGHKQEVFIATKFCRGADIENPDTYSEASVRAFCEASLRRLERDTLDLYQVHCPPTWVIEQGTVFEVLDKLQAEGKVRYYGVSVETVEEGLLALRYPGVKALQVIFNVFRQKPLAELFPQAATQGVGILARLPLASGLLTGKFHQGHVFHPEDHRAFNRNGEQFNVGETFAGLPFEKGVELSEQLHWLGADRGNLTRAALRWVVDAPGVTCAIPGFKNRQQVEDNLKALSVPAFTAEEQAKLQNFYATQVHAQIRGRY
ncbi:aldo/keto reductase [Alicyclobacillaceae bacterium I2511]|nr:aldo/keto reductase [Alicyclobacillaceae bacterium I2511]